MTVFKRFLDKIERKKRKGFYMYQHCNTKPKLLKPEAAANQATTL